MYILSIDVGIKNLAHCLVKTTNTSYEIVLWDTINLTDGLLPICNNIKCNGIAKYYDDNKCKYCMKHIKSSNMIIPNKSLLKYKNSTLKELNNSIELHNISLTENVKTTKKTLINDIEQFLNTKCVKPIESNLTSEISLVKLGIRIKEEYDIIFKDYKIEKVVIENQISPIATRMKSLQGMITQYFINNNINDIHYLCSANKLKDYTEHKKSTYSERKKLSIELVKDILEKDNNNWLDKFDKNTKKDDMADTLLQVLYFIKHSN